MEYSDEIYKYLQVDKNTSLVNVCYHPVTTDKEISEQELYELIYALKKFPQYTYIWSGINNDPGAMKLKKIILESVGQNRNHFYFDNLGKEKYFSLLKNAVFMIGNSSSGLLEASSFNLPVINVGVRQCGRLHGNNVIDVIAKKKNIMQAINNIKLNKKKKAVNPFINSKGLQTFFSVLSSLENFKSLKYKRLNCAETLSLQRVPEINEKG